MSKSLKAAQPDKCNGCELCSLESQRQLKKVGLEESLIRIFRKKGADPQTIDNSVEIDPRVNMLNTDKIREICPRNVFEIVEEGENQVK
jgi:ferredoxin